MMIPHIHSYQQQPQAVESFASDSKARHAQLLLKACKQLALATSSQEHQGYTHLLPGDIGHHSCIALEVAAHIHREYQIHATLLGKRLIEFLLVVPLHGHSRAGNESQRQGHCMYSACSTGILSPCNSTRCTSLVSSETPRINRSNMITRLILACASRILRPLASQSAICPAMSHLDTAKLTSAVSNDQAVLLKHTLGLHAVLSRYCLQALSQCLLDERMNSNEH